MTSASSRAPWPHVLHAIQADAAAGGVDHVHHVVEIQDQRVDVFAIERRDEGLVQPIQRVVGDLVALVFERLELVGRFPAWPFAREHVDEDGRGLADFLGELDEVVEEATIFRDQAESSHTNTPRRADGPCGGRAIVAR